MEYGFSVLMLIFGAAIMLYAAMLSGGNYKLLPIRVQPSLRRTDKKGQTKHIAKVTAVVGLSPLIGGLIGWWRQSNTVCLIGMVVTAAVCIVIAVLKKRRKTDE